MKTAYSYRETVSQMSYTNWRSGEPNYVGNSESCMVVVSYSSYKWVDISCGALKCYVCEVDI